MNRIQEVFKNKKAFIPFITAGDPDLNYDLNYFHSSVRIINLG